MASRMTTAELANTGLYPATMIAPTGVTNSLRKITVEQVFPSYNSSSLALDKGTNTEALCAAEPRQTDQSNCCDCSAHAIQPRMLPLWTNGNFRDINVYGPSSEFIDSYQ